jgi:NAD+ synthase (glutamine-hydrolysing)
MTGEAEDSQYLPIDPREFCGRIFHTCYMGTENSSKDTRARAKALSDAIGGFVSSPASASCVAPDTLTGTMSI